MTISPELERAITVRLIQEDTEAIYSLIKSERDSIFSMSVIPYYALFIQAFQEYVGENDDSNTEIVRIRNIRNHIKAYADGFGKSKKRVAQIDQMHDEEYKTQLQFEFLKSWNIHLNLGTYWTDDGIIIGNTQQLASFLEVDSIFDPNGGKKNYELGYQIGSFVNSVKQGLSQGLTPPEVSRSNVGIRINKYCDFNTNKTNPMFVDDSQKELNLFYLHLLCNMNYVKHILINMFATPNSWIFRIEYIVTYYTYRALQRLKNYCDNNKDVDVDTKDIEDLLKAGEDLFKSKFRNCMMHYDLVGYGVLSVEHINKPLFGMIETCFDGMSFGEYLERLRYMSEQIIYCLEKRFDFSKVELKNL